jgi:uncharacterized repeat protein (TIGR01451 family)
MFYRASATLAILAVAWASAETTPEPTRSGAATPTVLALTVHEDKTFVRRGADIVFTVTVTNDTGDDVAAVTVCDELPASVGTAELPPGIHLFDANACATYSHLKRGRTTLRITGRIARRARLGPDHDRAILIGAGIRSGAAVGYRVLPTRPMRRPVRRCT